MYLIPPVSSLGKFYLRQTLSVRTLGSRDRTRILRLLRVGKFILENGNKVPKFVRKTVKQELL